MEVVYIHTVEKREKCSLVLPSVLTAEIDWDLGTCLGNLHHSMVTADVQNQKKSFKERL